MDRRGRYFDRVGSIEGAQQVTEPALAFDKKDLRAITRSFKAMDETAIQQANAVSYELASYASQEIKKTAYQRTSKATGTRRVADGVRVSRKSKIGEFSYGFASQRFGGGATTQRLWAGLEFGSTRFKQFPSWSGRFGARGSRGLFIYPTLRKIQPELTRRWSEAFDLIAKEWVK
jgi:hypothetical protein